MGPAMHDDTMSDISPWPKQKLWPATGSRQRTTISTPNISSDRCHPTRARDRKDTAPILILAPALANCEAGRFMAMSAACSLIRAERAF
jgi:hypothetical protein